jgi:hypothetical protein
MSVLCTALDLTIARGNWSSGRAWARLPFCVPDDEQTALPGIVVVLCAAVGAYPTVCPS